MSNIYVHAFIYEFPSPIDPANVTVSPSVLVKEFNEQGSFICRGFGIDAPKLSWYRDNTMILSSSKLSLASDTITENGYSVSELRLTISSTAKADEGIYECRGVNNVINLIGANDRAIGRFLIEGVLVYFIIVYN